MPALRNAVSPGTLRSESTRAGEGFAMSSTVVTPKRASRSSVPRSRTCTWASISPGSSTPPSPSRTVAPAGSAPMRSPSMTTVAGGRNCCPSNTRTLVRAVFPAAPGRAAPGSVLLIPSPPFGSGRAGRVASAGSPVTEMAGDEVEVDLRGIARPPGDVLVRPDQQELPAPRVVRRCLEHRQRDTPLAGPVRQDRHRGVAGTRGPEQGEPGTQPVIQRGPVRQPRVRQPRARRGVRGVAAHVAGGIVTRCRPDRVRRRAG